MKQLAGTARNLVLLIDEETKRQDPCVECIIIVSTTHYSLGVGRTFNKEPMLEEIRFLASAHGLRQVAKDLVAWADEAERYGDPEPAEDGEEGA